jgi:hypothetical protein
MAFVRVLMGVLIALGGIVLAVPAVVLLDLMAGGTGLGLCPDGLAACETSMYVMAELILILAVALAVIGAGIAGCVRLLRKLEAGSP